MTFLKRIIFTTALSIICSYSFAEASRYDFTIPSFKTPTAETPKAKYAGELTFKNGAHISAYRLTLVSGIAESGWETPEIGSLKINTVFDPNLAKSLDAYAQPNGWMLVPKGWKPLSGGLGVDGSAALLFAPNKLGEMYLTYYNSGACMGCAVSPASLFFSAAKKTAKEGDFEYYDRANVKSLKMVKLRPTHVAYSYQFDQGNPVNGLGIYDEANEGAIYQDLAVRLPDQDKKVASAILNWYIPAK